MPTSTRLPAIVTFPLRDDVGIVPYKNAAYSPGVERASYLSDAVRNELSAATRRPSPGSFGIVAALPT